MSYETGLEIDRDAIPAGNSNTGVIRKASWIPKEFIKTSLIF
jgi:hypothetical protein